MEGSRGLGFRAQDRAQPGGVGLARHVGAQLLAGLIALVGLLGHQLADHGGKGRGHTPGDVLEWFGVVQPLPEDLVDHIAALERGPAGKGEIEGATDAVEVARA